MEKLEQLLASIIDAHSIRIHVIESRAKTVESFREKITKGGSKYPDPFKDLPDLCGCRVITYYGDEVETISDIIKAEFDVIEEELSHQPKELEADRFGYISAHYVVKLRADRSCLVEWASFKDLHAEIQIRTVIQHAWSAISHALQYKQETGIPSNLQRRLYRIAGLFELADEEFVGIRNQRAALQQAAADALAKGNKSIPLSSASITELLNTWELMPAILAAGQEAGFSYVFDDDDEDDDTIPQIYKFAEGVGLTTVEQLTTALTPPPVEFFTKLIETMGGNWTASPGFLLVLLIVARFIDDFEADDLTDWGWSPEIAKGVIETAQELKSASA
ncbi:MAG TPA: hypothetical protein VFH89_10740 [Sphingomicrobium sp.]|nr:hypothetical protein [Sphingomicrobium sp.]